MRYAKQTPGWARRLSLALITLSLFACGSPEMDDQQLVLTAKSYIAGNKIREAALELQNALQENSDNAEARYLLGQINLDVGDAAGAEKEFRRAARAGWKEEQAGTGLARALIRSNAFQRMIDEVEIKDAYPAAARANLYGLRAAAQAGLGQLVPARETLAVGAAIDANAFHVLKTTSQLQLASGDIQGAASTLKQALTAYPDHPELMLLSAIAAIQANDQAGAMAAYRNVIDQDSAMLITAYGRQARLGLARLQILDKDPDRAQSTLAPLFRRNANDPETNYLGSMLAFEQGNLDLAEERLLKVLKVVPGHAQTQLLFGTVSYAQKDYEQAAYYIAKYVSAVPENLGARKLLGRTYLILEQHDEAQAILQPGLEESAEDVELLALVGLSSMQGGNTAAGIEGLKKAVKLAPDSAALRGALAKAYLSSGETDHAIQELNTILAEGGGQEQTESLLVLAYLRAGNTDQAIDTVLKMLTRKPQDPAVMALVGIVFVVSDDRAEARKYFNRALQIKPGFVPATVSLARLEELEGNPEAATALYKGIVDSGAESTGPLLALARLAETRGKTEEMLGWLEKARQQAPGDIRPRVFLARYYLREKQLEKTDLLLEEAIRIAPRQPMLLDLQGRALMARRQYQRALSPLNELITRSPDSMLGRALLAEAYLELGQIDNARRQLVLVLEKQAYYLPALVQMARVELQSGHYEQALEYANRVQKVQPDLYAGYELSGDAWVAMKNDTEAKAVYMQAWKRRPSTALAIKLSAVAKRSGKPEEAIKPLLGWLKDHPDDAMVWQVLGTAYQGLGQASKAAEAYEKVLALEPENVVALNNLAWLYSLDKDPRALGLAERAYRAKPDNAGIQDTYGWLLVQQGQLDKGRHQLKQAMKKLSGVPEVRYHYAVALLKSGEEKEALQMLGKLLEENRSFEGRDEAERLFVLFGQQ